MNKEDVVNVGHLARYFSERTEGIFEGLSDIASPVHRFKTLSATYKSAMIDVNEAFDWVDDPYIGGGERYWE